MGRKHPRPVKTKQGAFEKRIGNEARKAGLFALFTEQSSMGARRWEFWGAATGKLLVTWFPVDGHWIATDGRRGESRGPFGAMHEAIAMDRGRINGAAQP